MSVMMVAFDTLRAARKLRDEGGFDEKQAAILVDTFAEGMGETLATKADLEVLRGDLEKTEDRAKGRPREDRDRSAGRP